MVKKLQDICLWCIGENLHRINRAGSYIPTVHKELLLERLANHDKLTPDYLPVITYNLFSHTLRHIKLYKCSQITDGVLKSLSASGCMLEHLTIHGCHQVTDVGIQAVTREQVELQVLHLRKLGITGRGFQQFESPKLIDVDLRGCTNLTTDGLKYLIQQNPTIKMLKLCDCSKLTDAAFILVAQELNETLECLDLEDNRQILNDDGLCAIAMHCPNLTKLNIYGSNRVSDKGVLKLCQCCTRLMELDLSYVSQLSSRPQADALWTLPNSLTKLSLCGILLEDKDLFVECITRLTNINGIKLSGVTALCDETLDRILQKIGGQLELIDLSGSVTHDLTDEGLHSISKFCTNLESLVINMLRNVTGVTLIPLFQDAERAENIKSLYLSCRKLSVEVLYAAASGCHNIEIMDLAGLDIVEDTLLVDLAENCKKLKEIGLKACRQVTDVGVCELSRCCPLRTVYLSGCNLLTDKSMFALANNCHYLEAVTLNGCAKISPVALRYLMDCCIERVWVMHKVPNAPPDQLMAKNLDTGEFCRADLMHMIST